MRYYGSVYRPPSEAYSLIVQVTYGCSHNTCAFCSMYKAKHFALRPLEEILEDFRMARDYYSHVEKVFLADGDALVRKASEILGEEYDCEVVEMHHRHKKDAPSGTALMLAKAAADGRGRNLEDVAVYGREGISGERPQGEIAVHALRGGSVIGDHSVVFAGDVERIEIAHKAQTREAFAAGALRAAIWAAGKKPGIYNMRDVLGL